MLWNLAVERPRGLPPQRTAKSYRACAMSCLVVGSNIGRCSRCLPAGLYAVLLQCRACGVKFITFTAGVKPGRGVGALGHIAAVVELNRHDDDLCAMNHL